MEEQAPRKVLARVIIEVLGAPRQYVDDTLRTVVDNIQNDSAYELLKHEVFPAVPQDDGLFNAFAEAEVLFRSPDRFAAFCFDYAPSSVEIIEPESLQYSARDLSSLMNDILLRLHTMNVHLKNQNAEQLIVNSNTENLLQNIVRLSLKQGKKEIAVISREVGIPEQQLVRVLEGFVKTKKIIKEEDAYRLP
ncbi:MAG TPA: hypothetical protein VJC16_07090 [Candidatus Nanoarchaeia archaeon]|nr:hypothetical protein [Candidatus Nanoarchaeia archaeon]